VSPPFSLLTFSFVSCVRGFIWHDGARSHIKISLINPRASSRFKLLQARVGHTAHPVSIFQRVRLYAVTHNHVYDFSRCSYMSPSPVCSCNTSDSATHLNVYFRKVLTSGYKDSVLQVLQEQTQINDFLLPFPYIINKCIFFRQLLFMLYDSYIYIYI
jgi:hypothetical protein